MRPSLFLRRELGRGAGPLDLIAACGAGLSGGGVRGAACGGAARGGTTRRSGRRKKGRLGCSPWNEVGVERVRLVVAAWEEDDGGGVRCARCGAATFGARGVAWQCAAEWRGGRCCARAGCTGGLCANGTMAVRWLRRRAGGGGEAAGATYGGLQRLRVECGEGRGGACALRGACGRMAWCGRAEARSSWPCAGSRRRALCAGGDARCMRERGARACARWRRRGRGWMTTASSLCMINAHHPRERRERRVARCLGQK